MISVRDIDVTNVGSMNIIRKEKKEGCDFFILLILIGFFIQSQAFSAELKQGRYFGFIELGPTKDKIAVVSDFYLQSPEDLKLFPALHATLKLTLGGFNTHEYITETFNTVRYDFENGILALNDPKNDIVITAEVKSINGNPNIEGDIFLRSSAVFGKLSLAYETDEPEGDRMERNLDASSFIPLLDGQYEGNCQGERAVLQLQTVRGLKTVWQAEEEASSLSQYYGISGRLGLENSIMCGDLPKGMWCTYFTYGGGSYNAYQGKLQLKGPSATDECTVQGDTLKCQIRRRDWNKDCTFKKTAPQIKDAKFYTRRFHLSPTTEQLKDLPLAKPPENSELSNAVRGIFAGYVHNEITNSYQYIQLNVIPFSFTENPHNPNQMMISSTATLHLGKDISSPFITQMFEPRSFYIRPGFTLNGPNTDTFINISQWKKGFIRGDLYSHAFGRVGTVQLIKGTPPAAPEEAEIVRSFVGEFEGPLDSSGVSAKLRWFRFLFPVQPNDLTDHLIRFSGSYTPVLGLAPVHTIDRGTFDPFTGVLGWIIEKDGAATFSNGSMDKNGNAQMYWPPAPGVFGAYMNDYETETFRRK